MKIKLVKQHDDNDCGAACISTICNFNGVNYPLAYLRKITKTNMNGTNIYNLIQAGRELGFKVDALSGSITDLLEGVKKDFRLPFIAHVISGKNQEHFIVVYKITKNNVIIADPASGIKKFTIEKFNSLWTGSIITFEKTLISKPIPLQFSQLNLKKLILPHKKLLFAAFFISLFITFIGIIGAFVFQIVIDSVTNDLTIGDMTKLNIIFVSLISLYILSVFLNIIRGRLQALFSNKFNFTMMLNCYNHIMDLPLDFFETRKSGEIISRISDTINIRNTVSEVIVTIMIDTFVMVFAGITLFKISFKLTAFVIFLLLLYVLLFYLYKNPISYINQEIMKNNTKITSFFKESIDEILTVKSYNQEKPIKDKIKVMLTNLFEDIYKNNSLCNRQDIFSTAIPLIGSIIILWLGLYECIKGNLSIGTLVTFNALIAYFFNPVKNIINLQPNIQSAIIATERINDILISEKEIFTNNKTDFSQDIHYEDIYFNYNENSPVLENINLTIRSGEKVAFAGESGCGKTTLIKLLMAFYTPNKGCIKIGSDSVENLSKEYLRSKIAYLPQNIILFTDTVLNNICIGNKNATYSDVIEICKRCAAHDFIMKMPQEYQTMLSEKGNNLSGGQRQRIAIARALIKKPHILILDEPTSNLDTTSEEEINNMLNKLDSKITCIIITHSITTLRYCDQIFVMKNGRIVENTMQSEYIKKYHSIQK